MYQLSEEEVDLVYERFSNSRLHNRMLEDELIDHICCVMELHMADGLAFEAAYALACATVCPNGMTEIEEETYFLLTYNKQLNMKRILFSLGFVSTFLLSFGFLFKLMHWPFASGLMIAAFAALFLTLAVLLVYSLQTLRALSLPARIRVISGLFSGILLAAGSIFKMLHYPGASMMIVVSLVLLNLLFLPLFFYQLYRKSIA